MVDGDRGEHCGADQQQRDRETDRETGAVGMGDAGGGVARRPVAELGRHRNRPIEQQPFTLGEWIQIDPLGQQIIWGSDQTTLDNQIIWGSSVLASPDAR